MIGWRCALCAVTMLMTAVLALGQQRVIIDTDPGTDDALAIYLALNSPELKVEAFTVVPGNVVAEQGLDNALRLISVAGMKTIIVKTIPAVLAVRIFKVPEGSGRSFFVGCTLSASRSTRSLMM